MGVEGARDAEGLLEGRGLGEEEAEVGGGSGGESDEFDAVDDDAAVCLEGCEAEVAREVVGVGVVGSAPGRRQEDEVGCSVIESRRENGEGVRSEEVDAVEDVVDAGVVAGHAEFALVHVDGQDEAAGRGELDRVAAAAAEGVEDEAAPADAARDAFCDALGRHRVPRLGVQLDAVVVQVEIEVPLRPVPVRNAPRTKAVLGVGRRFSLPLLLLVDFFFFGRGELEGQRAEGVGGAEFVGEGQTLLESVARRRVRRARQRFVHAKANDPRRPPLQIPPPRPRRLRAVVLVVRVHFLDNGHRLRFG
mmetsp:Transcript_8726/g.26827  ORF Transcript_8726/g.26827 Transcript_8726/m.26827 type:complete len:305 (+) Transcript_8726:311-1225(+)